MTVSMCEIVLYQEHYSTIDLIENICKAHETIKKYAICLHDQDKEADGESLKPHYHVILHFGRSQDTSMCELWFSCSSSAIEKIKGRWKDALLYLTHRNSPEKYQYPAEGVKASFDYVGELKRAEKEGKQKTLAQTLATSIMRGEKSYRQAFNELLEYDYTQNGTRFLRDAYNIYSRNIPADRDIDVFLIYGNSGTGKTTLAKWLCSAENKDYYVSASGADPLSDYMGEKVLILDDVREDTFSLVEWLKLLDNNTGSPIRSRYYNKVFVGDTIIITSSSNPVFWFLGTMEQRLQFYRRISQFICVTPEVVEQYNGFTMTSSGYVDPVKTGMRYKNPVKEIYPAKTEKNDSATRFCKAMTAIFEKNNKTDLK